MAGSTGRMRRFNCSVGTPSELSAQEGTEQWNHLDATGGNGPGYRHHS